MAQRRSGGPRANPEAGTPPDAGEQSVVSLERRNAAVPEAARKAQAEVVEPELVEVDPDAQPSPELIGADDLAAAEALSETAPATDEELEAIAAQLRGAAAPGTTALARRDPLAAYMGEVRRHPLLTREQEHELAVRWVEQGDAEAGRTLVTSNLRLVVKIAHEYRRAYQNLLDLVQEGNVGLVRAVQKFDPYRGVKLSTYSGWWIRAYILKYILNNWRLVKIGTTQNQRKLFFNLRKQRGGAAGPPGSIPSASPPGSTSRPRKWSRWSAGCRRRTSRSTRRWAARTTVARGSISSRTTTPIRRTASTQPSSGPCCRRSWCASAPTSKGASWRSSASASCPRIRSRCRASAIVGASAASARSRSRKRLPGARLRASTPASAAGGRGRSRWG
ncbi:MAG: sigma-70 family RNA polymerase sigma factor [Nannocystaceae bacterium]